MVGLEEIGEPNTDEGSYPHGIVFMRSNQHYDIDSNSHSTLPTGILFPSTRDSMLSLFWFRFASAWSEVAYELRHEA
jgi:hypothetical protein